MCVFIFKKFDKKFNPVQTKKAQFFTFLVDDYPKYDAYPQIKSQAFIFLKFSGLFV
jgi:hypothetical protein